MLDLLRSRHELTVQETLQILDPLAGAADHARSHGLPELDVTPAHILLAFAAAVDLPAQTMLMSSPVGSWPAFGPKVMPFGLRMELSNSMTWTGQQTIIPAARSAPGTVRQLALLAYEMLGGSPTAVADSSGRPQRAPLPALSEEGNAVLRRGLLTNEAAAYASATAFVAALRASPAAGRVEIPARAAAAPAAAMVPASLPPVRSGAPADSALATPSALPPASPSARLAPVGSGG